MGCFYEDYGVISSKDSTWVQRETDSLIYKFRQIGVKVNVCKSKYMISTPPDISSHNTDDYYNHRYS